MSILHDTVTFLDISNPSIAKWSHNDEFVIFDEKLFLLEMNLRGYKMKSPEALHRNFVNHYTYRVKSSMKCGQMRRCATPHNDFDRFFRDRAMNIKTSAQLKKEGRSVREYLGSFYGEQSWKWSIGKFSHSKIDPVAPDSDDDVVLEN